jgi:hypothetical protein
MLGDVGIGRFRDVKQTKGLGADPIKLAELLAVKRARPFIPPFPGSNHMSRDANVAPVAFAETADFIRDTLE